MWFTVNITRNLFQSDYNPGNSIGDVFEADGVFLNLDPAKGIQNVNIENNDFIRCQCRLDQNIKTVMFKNNTSIKSLAAGFRAENLASTVYSDALWIFENNTTLDARMTGFRFGTDANVSILFRHNTPINNSTHYNADTTLASSLFIENANLVIVERNCFGDIKAVPTQLRVAVVSAATTLRWGENRNIGEGINSLATILSPATQYIGFRDNLSATTTWNPPSLADGAVANTTLTVPGAELGNPVAVSLDSLTVANVLICGYVFNNSGIIRVTLMNKTGGVLDIGSGTLRATVFKY